jgi:hypothetical protein
VQELLFQTGTQYFSLSEPYQLSYISTHLQNAAEVFVLFPDGKLFQLFPQSSVVFEKEMVLEAGLS